MYIKFFKKYLANKTLFQVAERRFSDGLDIEKNGQKVRIGLGESIKGLLISGSVILGVPVEGVVLIEVVEMKNKLLHFKRKFDIIDSVS